MPRRPPEQLAELGGDLDGGDRDLDFDRPGCPPDDPGGPNRSNRSIIAWLRASISAVNVPTPSSSARALITSSSNMPSPCPCHASTTVTATSAVSGRRSSRT
jgi:hypothetical protein